MSLVNVLRSVCGGFVVVALCGALAGCGAVRGTSPEEAQRLYREGPRSAEGFALRMKKLVGTPEEQFMPRFAAVMQSRLGPDLVNADFPGGGRKVSEYAWGDCRMLVSACNGRVESYTYEGSGCVRGLPDREMPEPDGLPPVRHVRPEPCTGQAVPAGGM